MTEKLSERLEAIRNAAEETDDARSAGGDPRSVFVGMLPEDFDDTIRDAIALARRVEGAEVAFVEPKNGVAVIHERAMPLDLLGQRVRLVPEVGGG